MHLYLSVAVAEAKCANRMKGIGFPNIVPDSAFSHFNPRVSAENPYNVRATYYNGWFGLSFPCWVEIDLGSYKLFILHMISFISLYNILYLEFILMTYMPRS